MPPNTPILHQSSNQTHLDNGQLIPSFNSYDQNQISSPQNNINSINQLSNSNNLPVNFIDSNLDRQFIDSTTTSSSFNVVNSFKNTNINENNNSNKYLAHSHSQFNSNTSNTQNICSFPNTER